MSSEALGGPAVLGGPRIFDRLVVRVDVVVRGGPPLMPVALVFGITAVGYPVAIIAKSLPFALAMIVPLVILLLCLIAGLRRKLYSAANPYVTARWLAAAWAAFGTDIMTSAFTRISSRYGPDDLLQRHDLVERSRSAAMNVSAPTRQSAASVWAMLCGRHEGYFEGH